MQVFISDLHLTDGTSGQTINSGAFEVFRDNLEILVGSILKKGKVQDLKIVLLGDIFDVIRSTQWIDAGDNVRPWSEAGPGQNKVLLNIMKGILQNPENKKSLSYLADLREFADRRELGFELQYVIGNHDWLINRYPDCRQEVATALGMSDAETAPLFPTEAFDPDYRTLARHGDIYDEFNYSGNRGKSSLGDAVVIDLLDRFPLEVEEPLTALVAEKEITAEQKKDIVEELRELDNVRPIFDAPSWVLMISDKAGKDCVRQVLAETWERQVDALFRIPFIRDMNIPLWPDPTDKLRAVLQLCSHTSTWVLEKLAELKTRFFPVGPEGPYLKRALAEDKVRSCEADYVIYGHTHQHLVAPLDHIQLSTGCRDMVYFNTGTWRQTWNKVTLDKTHREFVGWKVLTYVSFYRKEENNEYNFEVWNGALG